MGATVPHQRVEYMSPDARRASRHHVRGEIGVSTQFIENVAKVGIVEPPLVREEGGELRVIDGMRRLAAAAEAGVESVPVIVLDVDDTEAASLALSVNLDVWRKSVAESDETSALNALIGGRRRVPHEFESEAVERIETAKYNLGMVTEAERIEHALADVHGVGRSASEELADEFESLDGVREASESDLQSTPGIGPTLASRITTTLESDSSHG